MYDQTPKYVMVTPNLSTNDNSNSTAKALNIAAIACMCLTRFIPVVSSFSLIFDDYSGRLNFYGLNSILILASLMTGHITS